MLFAITDIETTGSHASGNSIIEIGVCLHDGEKVIREFQTFLDPGMRLPSFITALTNITDDMLESAPTFHQIADELEEVLADAVFVAHNVNFDYSFIKAEFNAIGRNWNAPKLCTMRLARKAFPGFPSYGLNNLCNWLGITNEQAHRALSDARAAKIIFEKSLDVLDSDDIKKMIAKNSGEIFLPPNLDKSAFTSIPEKAGVYYFLNEKGKPIYIGKAKSLKKRVRQHFTTHPESQRMQAFMKEIFHITYELTGTELIALLLEDAEIRKHWPAYNSAQKRKSPRVNVIRYMDQNGYERLAIQTSTKIIAAYKSFSSMYVARNWLMELSKEFDVDMRLLGLDMFDVNRKLLSPTEHNLLLKKALSTLKEREPSFIIQDHGRDEGEQSFVLVKHGTFKGYAFVFGDHITLDDVEFHLKVLPATETNASILSDVSEHYGGYRKLTEDLSILS
jgi:DNA polymerase-3 subunit epsilon